MTNFKIRQEGFILENRCHLSSPLALSSTLLCRKEQHWSPPFFLLKTSGSKRFLLYWWTTHHSYKYNSSELLSFETQTYELFCPAGTFELSKRLFNMYTFFFGWVVIGGSVTGSPPDTQIVVFVNGMPIFSRDDVWFTTMDEGETYELSIQEYATHQCVVSFLVLVVWKEVGRTIKQIANEVNTRQWWAIKQNLWTYFLAFLLLLLFSPSSNLLT